MAGALAGFTAAPSIAYKQPTATPLDSVYITALATDDTLPPPVKRYAFAVDARL